MEGVHCTDILPVEMWEVILNHVRSMADLIHCYQTCTTWQTILFPRVRPTLVLHEVIPILWRTLGWTRVVQYRHIVNCRLVCRRWKRIIDDGCFLREDWDVEVNNISSLKKPNNPSSSNNASTVQGSKVWRREGYRYFREMDEEQTENPFLSSTLQYRFGGIWRSRCESMRDNGVDPLTIISTRHGRHVRNLVCSIGEESKIQQENLTTISTNFPNLRRLKLVFELSAAEDEGGLIYLEKADKSFMECLKTEKAGAQFPAQSHLCELTIFNPLILLLPLSRFISALISHSPRLKKVSIVWGSDHSALKLFDHRHFNFRLQLLSVLSSISSSAAVTQLALIGWVEEHYCGLGECLPDGTLPLKSLTVRLQSSGERAEGDHGVSRVFREVLKKCSGTLEELQIQGAGDTCQPHRLLLCRHREKKWGRVCACNEYYSKATVGSHRDTLQFQRDCKESRFERLTSLHIPHALLHPALFPGAMEACPALQELRIYHNLLDQSQSHAVNQGSRRMEDIFSEMVSELLPEMTSVRLLSTIIVQKWGAAQSVDYRLELREGRRRPRRLRNGEIST